MIFILFNFTKYDVKVFLDFIIDLFDLIISQNRNDHKKQKRRKQKHISGLITDTKNQQNAANRKHNVDEIPKMIVHEQLLA